jgi:GNAT superfamily N-acetyltransferase
MELTLQIEKWSDAIAELRPLFSQLWNDVAVDKDRFVAKCEEQKYTALETAGALCLTTIRADKRLVGYYAALILPNPHYEGQGLMAYTDMYWLDPDFRRGNIGLKLFQFTEKVWRERGAVKAYSSHKLHRPRSPVFNALGWTPTDVVYSKVLA